MGFFWPWWDDCWDVEAETQSFLFADSEGSSLALTTAALCWLAFRLALLAVVGFGVDFRVQLGPDARKVWSSTQNWSSKLRTWSEYSLLLNCCRAFTIRTMLEYFQCWCPIRSVFFRFFPKWLCIIWMLFFANPQSFYYLMLVFWEIIMGTM